MKKIFYAICLIFMVISCKKTDAKLTKIIAKTIEIDSTIQPSVALKTVISPYKEKLAAKMQKVLSYSSEELNKKDSVRQSLVGNLMADLSIEMVSPLFNKKTNETIDFVMFNYGGIRAIIPKGEVAVERAFKIMPFENELVVVELTGEKIKELISYFINNKKAHPLSKNVQLTIASGNYDLKINNVPFDSKKTYRVLTSDYLQSGGDRMTFFKDPVKLTKLNYKFRDVIIDYFKEVDTLKSTIDNRIIVK
ncbi:UDP-sugar hydrolase [Tenacibaculum holothuriorum]|uniref:UDP-sugar hydrolase n=1 Tax=Tenacibaculum holothuriorum TaxID=1635173 RepID=A0A1Y2PC62_9FLAO|nr:5'-nucleotidase [Tenacibaculum holothuriorum]OSY88063.1 UDP-sugar hydrolase [Tenacibaculum holothuriorum]